jgi:hypothetical protein
MNSRFYNLMFSLLMMSGVACAAQPESQQDQQVQQSNDSNIVLELKNDVALLNQKMQELKNSGSKDFNLKASLYQDTKAFLQKLWNVRNDIVLVGSWALLALTPALVALSLNAKNYMIPVAAWCNLATWPFGSFVCPPLNIH